MQIKKVHIQNYKGIKELTREFEPGVTILIGNNGVGKTSLLSALNVVLESMFMLSHGILGRERLNLIPQKDIHTTSVTAGDITESMKYHVPVEIVYDIEIDGEIYNQQCRIEHEGNRTVFPDYQVPEKMEELLNQSDSVLPLLNYQSIDRANLLSNIREAQLKGDFERRQGYVNSFVGKSSIEDVQDWCLSMAFAEFQLRRKIKEYETFKKIVSRFVQKIESMKSEPKIELSPTMKRLVFSDKQESQLINNLSAGYQSVLCMIMELAYRTVLLNPSIDGTEDVDGIVLIDEIDMHLHPKWQWRIIDALCSLFPKVQFVVATHSPMIISSAENARLLLMSSPNEIEELPDAYGLNVDNILELRQRSEGMPPELKEWRKRIMRFLNQNDVSSAESVIREAEVKRGKYSAPAKALRDFYDINKWIAEV